MKKISVPIKNETAKLTLDIIKRLENNLEKKTSLQNSRQTLSKMKYVASTGLRQNGLISKCDHLAQSQKKKKHRKSSERT